VFIRVGDGGKGDDGGGGGSLCIGSFLRELDHESSPEWSIEWVSTESSELTAIDCEFPGIDIPRCIEWHFSPAPWEYTREYRMILQRTRLSRLRMIWFIPYPLSPYPLSLSVCRRSSLLTAEEGEGGWGRSHIIRRRESLVPYKSFNTLWKILIWYRSTVHIIIIRISTPLIPLMIIVPCVHLQRINFVFWIPSTIRRTTYVQYSVPPIDRIKHYWVHSGLFPSYIRTWN
jgi:hypothetical protein